MKTVLQKLSFILCGLYLAACSTSEFSTFVSADKDKLIAEGEELRFISFNIPNLHNIEDNFPFDETNPWRLPDEFEIRDALLSIKQMGGQVARTYVVSVKRPDDDPRIIRHVEGPGKFNEDAFRAFDKVMQVANEVGVRVIIPLVDNWIWMGGRAEYAAFRGKDKDDFWTDPQLIEDFKQTINFIVNRKNVFTGQLYRDDKALFGWETGNELFAPTKWHSDIAAYIKSLDPNHLVIEGTAFNVLRQESIDDPNIDVLSTHYYEPAKSAIPKILKNKEMTEGKKPYFVGEFGFIPSYEFKAIIDSVIDNNVNGALLWSLRFRNRDGGFYKHYEQRGFSAYNWPGFLFNDPYNEKAVLALVNRKAHEISNKQQLPFGKPLPPVMLATDNVYKLSWKGSAGAVNYVIERKQSNGDWEILDVVNDTRIAYRPQYSDNNVESGKSYFYRLRAWNGEEISNVSNEIGPVSVPYKMIVDEFFDDTFIFEKSGDLQFESMENVRQAKEDRSRLAGTGDVFIIYKTGSDIINFTLDTYFTRTDCDVKIFSSTDGKNFIEITSDKTEFPYGKNDYGYFTPVRFAGEVSAGGQRFIKIVLENNIQLSRLEISYK